MGKHTGLRAGILLMATAALLRGLSVGDHAAADRPLLPKLPAQPRVWVIHKLPPAREEPAPAPAPVTFSAEEAPEIGGACTYAVDKAALLTAPCPVALEDGPQVLILHTHTSEAYTQTAGWTYTESDPLRTTDGDASVVRVGREVAAALEEAGLEVLHDESLNDYPDYNSAYRTAREKTQKWLQDYPSIRVVLDIHRDAIADGSGGWTGEAVGLNGESCAKVMLVVGTDQGGGEHPHWQDNLNFAMKVQAAVSRSYPALCKPMDLRRERFNQQLLPGAMLVEIGSAGNTLPEALRAARAFGTALGGYLKTL